MCKYHGKKGRLALVCLQVVVRLLLTTPQGGQYLERITYRELVENRPAELVGEALVKNNYENQMIWL
jgi:hypothetical protein